MTACAPNFLALEFIRKIAKIEINYAQWTQASLLSSAKIRFKSSQLNTIVERMA